MGEHFTTVELVVVRGKRPRWQVLVGGEAVGDVVQRAEDGRWLPQTPGGDGPGLAGVAEDFADRGRAIAALLAWHFTAQTFSLQRAPLGNPDVD